MVFEWNPAKSASNKLKHGVSFEEVEEALERGAAIDSFKSRNHPGQELIVFRNARGILYVVAIEQRGDRLRIVTAHRDRKLEKKYAKE